MLRAEDDVFTNHIHADDLARATIAAAFRGKPNRAYNVSDDAELKMLFAANKLNNLPQVKSLLTARPPVWPVLLAGALFLYLWWLATLVFDLAFVWQRYVRGSVANDRLREWSGESHYNI